MRVLITGHLGYIGVNMTSVLAGEGHDVVGLDTNLFAGCDFLAAPDEVPTLDTDLGDVTPGDLGDYDAVEFRPGRYALRPPDIHPGHHVERRRRHGAIGMNTTRPASKIRDHAVLPTIRRWRATSAPAMKTPTYSPPSERRVLTTDGSSEDKGGRS